MFFTDAEKAEMRSVGVNLVIYYAALSVEAFREGQILWRMTPKLHLFVHLCEWQCSTMGNPRFCWCYSDEGLAGAMARVAETCHPATMAGSALFKWMQSAF